MPGFRRRSGSRRRVRAAAAALPKAPRVWRDRRPTRYDGAVEMQPLPRSRAVEELGYDPASRSLRVRFRNGGLYDYLDVPAEIFAGLLTSAHPWTEWGERIKG